MKLNSRSLFAVVLVQVCVNNVVGLIDPITIGTVAAVSKFTGPTHQNECILAITISRLIPFFLFPHIFSANSWYRLLDVQWVGSFQYI